MPSTTNRHIIPGSERSVMPGDCVTVGESSNSAGSD